MKNKVKRGKVVQMHNNWQRRSNIPTIGNPKGENTSKQCNRTNIQNCKSRKFPEVKEELNLHTN